MAHTVAPRKPQTRRREGEQQPANDCLTRGQELLLLLSAGDTVDGGLKKKKQEKTQPPAVVHVLCDLLVTTDTADDISAGADNTSNCTTAWKVPESQEGNTLIS